MAKCHEVSSAQKKLRIHKVFEMIIASKSTASIIQFSMDKWGVTIQTAYRYLAGADKVMKEHLKGKKETRINKAIHQREHIIEKLMDSKNYAMAAQALADKNKLENLYENDTIDSTVTIKVIQK